MNASMRRLDASGCLKLAFVAIRNSHSKRRRLCVVVAVSRRGFVAGSRLPPRRLLACPLAFVAVNNIHPWIIVGQSTGESIVPVSLPSPPLPPPPFATVLSLSTIYHVFARQFQMFNSFSRREKLFFFYCSSTISGTSFDRKKEIQGVEADREIDQFSR